MNDWTLLKTKSAPATEHHELVQITSYVFMGFYVRWCCGYGFYHWLAFHSLDYTVPHTECDSSRNFSDKGRFYMDYVDAVP